MPTVDIGTIIRLSFNRTVEILFRPFSIKKWLKLIFIALFAGALGMGGGTGGNNSGVRDRVKESASENRVSAAAVEKPGQTVGASAGDRLAAFIERVKTAAASPRAKRLKVWFIATLAVLFLLGVLLIWFCARFPLIWAHAVMRNTADIMEPFHRYRVPGNSLFRFNVVVSVLSLGALALLVRWGYGLVKAAGMLEPGYVWSLAALLPFLSMAAVLGIGLLAGALVWWAVAHFLVPLMALNNETLTAALRKFWPVLMNHKGDVAVFCLVFFGFKIVAGIMAVALMFLVFIVAAVAGVVLFGLVYVVLVVLLKAKIMAIVAGIVIGAPFIVLLILAAAAIQLPFAVFFRSLSLYFLSTLSEEFRLLPLEKPAV